MSIFRALINTYQKASTIEWGPEPQSALSPTSAWHSELVSGVATGADMEAPQKANA